VNAHRALAAAISSILLGATLAIALPASASAAPPTPTNLQLVARSGSALLLSWDWNPAATYELSYGDTSIPFSSPPGYITPPGVDFSPGHSYLFQVRAVTANGQKSAPATLPFETTPPSAVDLGTVGAQNVVSWSAATDNSGVIKTYEVRQVRLKNTLLIGKTTSTTANIRILVTKLFTGEPLPGPMTIEVRAVDKSLNLGPLSDPVVVNLS